MLNAKPTEPLVRWFCIRICYFVGRRKFNLSGAFQLVMERYRSFEKCNYFLVKKEISKKFTDLDLSHGRRRKEKHLSASFAPT